MRRNRSNQLQLQGISRKGDAQRGPVFVTDRCCMVDKYSLSLKGKSTLATLEARFAKPRPN